MQKLLVPVSEVPTGFTLRPSAEASNNQTRVCDVDTFPSAPRTAHAHVSFSSGQVAVLSEELTSYASARQAQSVLQSARAVYERCTAYDRTDDRGAVTHYTIAPTSSARLSADQVAVQVTFTADAFSGTGDFVAARVGALIMVTAGLSVSSPAGAGQLDPDNYTSFTKTAYQRIT